MINLSFPEFESLLIVEKAVLFTLPFPMPRAIHLRSLKMKGFLIEDFAPVPAYRLSPAGDEFLKGNRDARSQWTSILDLAPLYTILKATTRFVQPSLSQIQNAIEETESPLIKAASADCLVLAPGTGRPADATKPLRLSSKGYVFVESFDKLYREEFGRLPIIGDELRYLQVAVTKTNNPFLSWDLNVADPGSLLLFGLILETPEKECRDTPIYILTSAGRIFALPLSALPPKEKKVPPPDLRFDDAFGVMKTLEKQLDSVAETFREGRQRLDDISTELQQIRTLLSNPEQRAKGEDPCSDTPLCDDRMA